MKSSRVLVTGAQGYVGSRTVELLSEEYDLISFSGDITDESDVSDTISEIKPQVVVHAAGKTHIDRCEGDVKNGKNGIVWKTNVLGTQYLAQVCQKRKIFFIYLSTECVFDGKRGKYTEADATSPISWYGSTKYEGEHVTSELCDSYCILRSVLAYGHPRVYTTDVVASLSEKIKHKQQVRVVRDQEINPTYIDDLVRVISYIVKERPQGVLHYAGKERYSIYEIARLICAFFHTSEDILFPVTMEEYFSTASHLRLKKSTLTTSPSIPIAPSDFHQSMEKMLREIV